MQPGIERTVLNTHVHVHQYMLTNIPFIIYVLCIQLQQDDHLLHMRSRADDYLRQKVRDVMPSKIYQERSFATVRNIKAQYWPLCFARLCCCFGFHGSEASIVIKEQKPQNFQHHKHGRQEIVACNAQWAIPGL